MESEGSQAHELYTPKSRLNTFPEADLRFLVHVAANIVRVFGTVHQSGCVIGDVNHGHLLVGKDGRVTLIDCDSFQVQSAGHVYTCDVGVPLFTAPELQGRSFRGLERTPNHDLFGLAVLLFQLLFMGRHPYAGVPLDPKQSPEVEAAIRAGRFAYGGKRRALGIEQPPGTIPLSTYGPHIAALFESAFSSSANSARPDASTWLAALKGLQASLTTCSSSPAHFYSQALSGCPWCAIEARTGGRLFGTRLRPQGPDDTIQLEKLWSEIIAIPEPARDSEPPIAGLRVPPRPAEEIQATRQRRWRKAAAVIVALACFWGFVAFHQSMAGALVAFLAGAVLWPRVPAAQRSQAQAAEAAAKAVYDELIRQWQQATGGSAFVTIKTRLEQAKTTIDGLPAERARRLAVLKSEAKQREDYLDRFRVSQTKIAGIGPGRIAALASFGIETAWDVSAQRVQAVPGFGPNLASKLTVWRATQERAFRFNPNHPVAAAEVNQIEAEISTKRAAAMFAIRAGAPNLKQAASECTSMQAKLVPEIRRAWEQLAIARRRSAQPL